MIPEIHPYVFLMILTIFQIIFQLVFPELHLFFLPQKILIEFFQQPRGTIWNFNEIQTTAETTAQKLLGMAILENSLSRKTQNIDAGPTMYKCHTNVLCLLGLWLTAEEK